MNSQWTNNVHDEEINARNFFNRITTLLPDQAQLPTQPPAQLESPQVNPPNPRARLPLHASLESTTRLLSPIGGPQKSKAIMQTQSTSEMAASLQALFDRRRCGAFPFTASGQVYQFSASQSSVMRGATTPVRPGRSSMLQQSVSRATTAPVRPIRSPESRKSANLAPVVRNLSSRTPTNHPLINHAPPGCRSTSSAYVQSPPAQTRSDGVPRSPKIEAQVAIVNSTTRNRAKARCTVKLAGLSPEDMIEGFTINGIDTKGTNPLSCAMLSKREIGVTHDTASNVGSIVSLVATPSPINDFTKILNDSASLDLADQQPLVHISPVIRTVVLERPQASQNNGKAIDHMSAKSSDEDSHIAFPALKPSSSTYHPPANVSRPTPSAREQDLSASKWAYSTKDLSLNANNRTKAALSRGAQLKLRENAIQEKIKYQQDLVKQLNLTTLGDTIMTHMGPLVESTAKNNVSIANSMDHTGINNSLPNVIEVLNPGQMKQGLTTAVPFVVVTAKGTIDEVKDERTSTKSLHVAEFPCSLAPSKHHLESNNEKVTGDVDDVAVAPETLIKEGSSGVESTMLDSHSSIRTEPNIFETVVSYASKSLVIPAIGHVSRFARQPVSSSRSGVSLLRTGRSSIMSTEQGRAIVPEGALIDISSESAAHTFTKFLPQKEPQVETSHRTHGAVDRQYQLYFDSWIKPESRVGGNIRQIKFTGLPTTSTVRTVTELVFGGPLEHISYQPGASSAIIRFLNSEHCRAFYEHTANGIECRWAGDRLRFVWVELGKEVNPINGRLKDMIEKGYTRVVRVVGLPEDWTLTRMKEFGQGLGAKSPLEHVELHARLDGVHTIRTGLWRFCDVHDAYVFRAERIYDPAFEHCNIQFGPDPCAEAHDHRFVNV